MNPANKRQLVQGALASAIKAVNGSGGLAVVIDKSGDVHVAFLAPPSRVDALKVLACMPDIVENLAGQIIDRLPAPAVLS